MRYAQVSPHGVVEVHDTNLEATILDGGFDEHLDVGGITVWYDTNSSGAFNWQAQRLLRDRLMPEDRICGDVIVTGVVSDRTATPSTLDDEVIDSLKERYEQHTH